MSQLFISRLLCAVTLAIGCSTAAWGEEPPKLVDQLQPFCAAWSRANTTWTVNATVPIDGKPQTIDAEYIRYDDQAYNLALTHEEYSLRLVRRADETALALPKHQVMFVGKGKTDADDHLALPEIIRRLVSVDSEVSLYASILSVADAPALAFFLTGLLKAKYDAEKKLWQAGDVTFAIADEGRMVEVVAGETRVQIRRKDEAPPIASVADGWREKKVVALERTELERTVVRGLRRMSEISWPALTLTKPAALEKRVPHGELRWIEGQRVCLLSGTPEQVGQAHGELLRTEAHRCIDSVLHAFGLAQTVRTGRWFREDLAAAQRRLAPHIPADHVRENAAMAEAIGITPQLAHVVNVFPELFECSGFAVCGKATVDGKLYHGRVLDYMTTIGLQDSSVVFVVAVDGKLPFVNVGYAGFIGSVTGMNDQAISLGEMGGRGEGKWDGAPMATLMRRALEECRTLDEVQTLWQKSPRTCEYYYVFADGKTNRAVGVAATPEKVEFVGLGQSHPLLGEGIEDAVVLSADDRLKKLRERVKDQYGKIDTAAAQGLMCRPVAMSSNLHNVLFVPQDGLFYVAHASHTQPAADRPYVKMDLKQLLSGMRSEAKEER